MNILVLYTIHDDADSFACEEVLHLPNAIEIPYTTSSCDFTLGYLLSQLPKCLWEHMFYVEQYRGKYEHLSATSSVIPVTKRNVVFLKLVKSGLPPYVPENQLNYYHTKSLSQNKKTQSTKDNSNYPFFANKKDQQSSSAEKSFQSFVGDDTAAAWVEAAETAKVVATATARSFLSFAQTMGKSLLEVANNVSISSGGGILNPGSVVSMSTTKVTVQKLLSEGGFGTVYVVRDENTDKLYALKQLLCQSKEQVVEGHNEIDVLVTLKDHAGIIPLVDYSSTQIGSSSNGGATSIRQILLLFPLFPRGTAWDELERALSAAQQEISRGSSSLWPFPEKKALYILLKVASALQFMHDRGFSHRDVKPHNILLSDHARDNQLYEPVLMDFGSVSHARVQLQTRQECLLLEEEAARKTSAAYRAPELYSPPFVPCEIDERVDTWALGCTLYALAFGRSPFDSSKEGVSKLAIMNGKYQIPNNGKNRDFQYSARFLALVEQMLHVDAKNRPYMHEILEQFDNRPSS